ncbi:hypothetical protein ACWFQT_01470 [Cellulosimicrobium cellulans]
MTTASETSAALAPAKAGPVSDKTALEMYHSVVGGERDIVSRVFKSPLARLAKDDPETFTQALVLLDLRRRGEGDAQGKAAAMTVGELQGYFAQESEDDAGEA